MNKHTPFSPTVSQRDFVDLSSLGGPRFVLTVDTEEEFDRASPFSRDYYGMTHLKAVPRFQEMCDNFGIKPCYLIDYPITEDSFGIEMISEYAHSGRAEIGVHLHPWVSPPFIEEVNVYNSFSCNLPPELERAKLANLHAAIVSRTGLMPDAHRAGQGVMGQDRTHHKYWLI